MHCIVYAIFNESPQWFPSIYKSSGINLEFPPSQPFKLGPSAFPLGILAMIDSISGYGHLEIKKRSGSLICLTKSRHLESKPSRLVMTSFPPWNHLWIIKGYWGSWYRGSSWDFSGRTGVASENPLHSGKIASSQENHLDFQQSPPSSTLCQARSACSLRSCVWENLRSRWSIERIWI